MGFETKAAIVGYIVGGDMGVVDVGSGSLCVGHVVERGWVNLGGRGLDIGRVSDKNPASLEMDSNLISNYVWVVQGRQILHAWPSLTRITNEEDCSIFWTFFHEI